MQVLSCGAVAVVRLSATDTALRVVDALQAGGVHAVEITLTTPGAIAIIAALSQRNDPRLVIGAGSVLDVDSARQSMDAGATYLVSPVLRTTVLHAAHANDTPYMPGAYTPTEILTAHDMGADVVKVFPADSLGPAYIKGVMAPMPFLRLMPTGGVTPANIGTWIAAGAVAVGLGSALVDAGSVARGDFHTITERAHVVAAAIVAARTPSRSQ